MTAYYTDMCEAKKMPNYYRIRQNFQGGKLSRFSANRENFPLESLLCTVHNGMGLMHRKSFPVNGVFCAQPREFSPSKVLPYTVQVCGVMLHKMSRKTILVFILSL